MIITEYFLFCVFFRGCLFCLVSYAHFWYLVLILVPCASVWCLVLNASCDCGTTYTLVVRRRVLVVNIFRIFEFVVAMSDLVPDMDAILGLC